MSSMLFRRTTTAHVCVRARARGLFKNDMLPMLPFCFLSKKVKKNTDGTGFSGFSFGQHVSAIHMVLSMLPSPRHATRGLVGARFPCPNGSPVDGSS